MPSTTESAYLYPLLIMASSMYFALANAPPLQNNSSILLKRQQLPISAIAGGAAGGAVLAAILLVLWLLWLLPLRRRQQRLRHQPDLPEKNDHYVSFKVERYTRRSSHRRLRRHSDQDSSKFLLMRHEQTPSPASDNLKGANIDDTNAWPPFNSGGGSGANTPSSSCRGLSTQHVKISEPKLQRPRPTYTQTNKKTLVTTSLNSNLLPLKLNTTTGSLQPANPAPQRLEPAVCPASSLGEDNRTSGSSSPFHQAELPCVKPPEKPSKSPVKISRRPIETNRMSLGTFTTTPSLYSDHGPEPVGVAYGGEDYEE